jgi:phosphoenolpyruvate synthase/pyruvate phosphate dikinase
MIKVKLKELSKRLNKSISEISNDTGLNRNTISALINEKVDGIRFDTLEKLQRAYKIRLDDILEMEILVEPENEKLYTQEGEIVPFTAWFPFLSLNSMPSEYFGEGFGKAYGYFKNDYMTNYWNENAMFRVSKYVYEEYSNPKKLEKLFKLFLIHADSLENIYHNSSDKITLSMDNDELVMYCSQLFKIHKKFWQYSCFIDGFDSGFDYQKINDISKKYNLSAEDISALTIPSKITFGSERILMMLEIVKKISRKKIKEQMLDKFLDNFIETDPQIASYRRNFDYYKSNYAHIDHITNNEIKEEIKNYLNNRDLLNGEYFKLKNYSRNHSKKIKRILSRLRLKQNPLFFFNQLTYWREYRKKINLMSFHIYENVLAAIEAKTGIPRAYLKYLSFEEVENALKGLISLQVLKERREKGMVIIFEKDKYKILIGKEADSFKEELDLKVEVKTKSKQMIISGQVASQGYAKGIARIILNKNDFGKFREGEVLVTGMTKPEFVPLMKMAIAIVTNEGGITCHAAIVSRELGKPCIIGTKNATEIIKDGDLVEVRAHHGTIRILK